MSGAVPFISLRPCGCVFSDASIRAVVPTLTKGVAARVVTKSDSPDEAKPVVDGGKGEVACPNCGKKFDSTLLTSILPINPTREVQAVLLENLLTSRAAAKSTKKRKVIEVVPSTVALEAQRAKVPRNASSSPVPRASSASPAPGRGTPPIAPSSLARSVHKKLAEQEQKRLMAQAGMSDAVKAMFKPRPEEKGHHKGNADFFGRTFTRVGHFHPNYELS